MEQSFPTFLELKKFIQDNPEATICEIRDKFNQTGEAVISIKKDKCKNKELVLAYGINSDFFEYLQTFIKEDYVICRTDIIACRISDRTWYTGKGEFLPITLSIKKDSLF